VVVSAAEAPAPFGSSNRHIVPPGRLAIAMHGEMLELKYKLPERQGHTTGTRGDVCGFSPKSRTRMRKLLAALHSERMQNDSLFVTLTYPSVYPDAPRDQKSHLTAFVKRLVRRFPGLGVVWKVELQERGAPHFHVLTIGQRFIPHEWIARVWYEVVGSGDPSHLAAGTQIKAPENKKAVKKYMGKYLAKQVDI
jgi:hypothetical protein